jgi:hypothetical protein
MSAFMNIAAIVVVVVTVLFLFLMCTVAGAIFWFNQILPFFRRMRRK